MMRVLVDKHHADLFHSLQLLFEDRLGGLVYTPVGHEWWDEGYWQFGQGYGDDRLAQQFLSLDGWECFTPEQSPGYRTYRWHDPHHPEREVLGVELGAVKAAPREFRYVVATVQDNQSGFRRLADEIDARYVLQVGNINAFVDWSLDPLALVSSEAAIRGRGVRYHQEFDTEGTFRYREPTGQPVIRSFVNCFPTTPCVQSYNEVASYLLDFDFSMHGIDGDEGNVAKVADIAELMAGSAFGWHDKVQGDGFGHVLHDWAAVGRPLIGHGAHYRGLMGERFWQDMVTCIDLDKHSTDETAQLIRDIVADPARHRAMCEAIRQEVDAIDFAAEAESIRELLSLQAVAA